MNNSIFDFISRAFASAFLAVSLVFSLAIAAAPKPRQFEMANSGQ